MASETKHTQLEQASWLVKSLTNHLLEIKDNKNTAQITTDGQYTKGSSRESKFSLAPGESFQGPADHHSSSTMNIIAIDGKGLQLNYEMRFDHRSFGKDLITVDKGSVVVPLKSEKSKPNTIANQFEILRKDIPEAKTISEQNGVSIPDAKGVYYTCTRLGRAASELKLDTADKANTALKYLEDDDYKLRFIAASALANTFKTHPNGLSMSDVEDRKNPRHAKLVETFKAAITKHF